jgi:hypothetical protein
MSDLVVAEEIPPPEGLAEKGTRGLNGMRRMVPVVEEAVPETALQERVAADKAVSMAVEAEVRSQIPQRSMAAEDKGLS